jgi:hypothetical protein
MVWFSPGSSAYNSRGTAFFQPFQQKTGHPPRSRIPCTST